MTDRSALLWVAAGASLWGADTLLRRPLTAALSSVQIVLIEHLVLTTLLLIPFWRRRLEFSSLGARQWRAILWIAWGGSALATICFTEAIKIGNPTTAVLLQKSQPLFAAVLARALLGEPLGRRFWSWLGLALVAGWLISFGDGLDWNELAAARAPAVLLALAAAALWGSSTVLGRFVLGSLSFSTLTVLRFILATPMLMALAWLSSGPFSARLNPSQSLSLLLMALIPGLAALLIYYRGLSHVRASRAAIAELAYPATATVLNWVFLGARVSAAQLAGFALLWLVILQMEKRN